MREALLLATTSAGRVRLDPEVLKARRHQLGLSQEAFALACFARQLCVSIASVKRAETGKSLLLRTARHLAEFHGLALQALLLPATPDGETGLDEVADLNPVAAPVHEPVLAGIDLRQNGGGEQALAMPHAGDIDTVDGRFVQVLCIWPVSDREREAVTRSLLDEGGSLMPPPQVDAVLAVFGLPRAQRGDVTHCLSAARRWRDRHVLVCGGWWLGSELEWPGDCLRNWARRQPADTYVHRSVFGQVKALHHVEPSSHADIACLRAPHKQAARQFKLVGRQHELRLFNNLLDAVLADQQSQVMLVQGMAGMGKSRLLAEMVDMAQQHFACAVQIELQDFGGDRHREVMASLLRALLDLSEITPFWAQLAQQRVAHFELPPDQLLVCKDLLGMSLPAEERTLLEAMGHAGRGQVQVRMLARIMGRMAVQRPLLMVVEDTHWASAATVETLARLMSISQESQVLWVLSGRVEAPQRLADLQRLVPDVAVTSLSLAPLRAQEVQELAQQFSHVDKAWRDQCMQRAQGHPLFLTQLLMADRHERLPDNFQHLLQVRLDEVSPQDRLALRLASILGQPFSAHEVHAVMQANGYQFDVLVRHCFLRHLEGERYDFLHALIRQGVYEALPARQRDAMHTQVARYYEPRNHALCAQHLHLGRQAGAPAALLAAARERHELFDQEGALSLLQMYAGIDYAEQAVHAHAMLLGDVYAKMGQMPQARQAYERAMAHAPDALSGLNAKVALASVLNVLEDLTAEEALIDEALPEAGSLQAHAQLATLHYLKGNLYFPRGDVARSRMHHTRAMTVAQEAGAARVQAQALSGLGDSYYAEGLMGTANAHFVRCLQLCDEHGLRDIEASNRFMLATTQIYLCQTEEALRQAVASAELARRVGNRRAEIVSRLTASWVELSGGRPREALDHIDEGLMLSRAMGAMRFEPFLQEAQARAQYALGDEVQAQRTIQSALDSVERLKLHAFIGPWVLGTWALLHHPEGSAVQALARGEAMIERGCVAHNVYRFYACAMEVHVLAGRHEMAEQVGQRWLARTAAEPMPWVAGLHAFMKQCCAGADLPHPDQAVWQCLREQQALHVMLKLPRELLR